MNTPQTVATETSTYFDPATGKETFRPVNKGTLDTPDWQWKRNPTYSVIRELTDADEIRVATNEFNTALALGKVKRGTFEQLKITDALFFIVQETDELLAAKWNGGYVGRNGNMFKIEHYDEGITLNDLVNGDGTFNDGSIGGGTDSGSGGTGGTDGGNTGGGTGGTTGPVDVGNFGIQVDGMDILLNAGYFVIRSTIANVEVYNGEGNQAVTMINGNYRVENLTTGNVTVDVAVPQGVSGGGTGSGGSGSGSGGSGTGGTNGDGNTIDIGDFGVALKDNTFRLPEGSYFQIQLVQDSVVVDNAIFEGQGPADALVANGTYHVINLTTLERINNVIVPGGAIIDSGGVGTTPAEAIGAFGVTLDDRTFIFPNTNYFQLQLVDNNVVIDDSVFEGQGPTTFTVADGTYHVIDLTSGNRINNIVIPYVPGSGDVIDHGDFGVKSQGTAIILPTTDYWQILSIPNYDEVFQGVGNPDIPVEVGKGTFSVINLTTAQRVDNVVLN